MEAKEREGKPSDMILPLDPLIRQISCRGWEKKNRIKESKQREKKPKYRLAIRKSNYKASTKRIDQ